MLLTFLVLHILMLKHLIQNMIQAFVHILSLYIIYDWIIIIMGDSKHELSTINMLYSLKKIVI